MKLTPRQKKVFDYLKAFSILTVQGNRKASTLEIQQACLVCNVAKVVYELRELGINIPPAEYFGKSTYGNRIFFYWLEAA